MSPDRSPGTSGTASSTSGALDRILPNVAIPRDAGTDPIRSGFIGPRQSIPWRASGPELTLENPSLDWVTVPIPFSPVLRIP